MAENKGNGHCKQQNEGCTEVQLMNARVEIVEGFVKGHEENQRWHMRYQKTTTVGVYIAVGLLLLKIFILG